METRQEELEGLDARSAKGLGTGGGQTSGWGLVRMSFRLVESPIGIDSSLMEPQDLPPASPPLESYLCPLQYPPSDQTSLLLSLLLSLLTFRPSPTLSPFAPISTFGPDITPLTPLLHPSSANLHQSYDLLPQSCTPYLDTALYLRSKILSWFQPWTLTPPQLKSIALVTSFYVNTIANISWTFNPASQPPSFMDHTWHFHHS
ncbi:uncharacterized protein EI90DRAFT_3133307 [Cantharellus anzutake]|uniref:uncharacterized protein n=1 Tax=Cantharellus anzutake TaxID=1750568 RepID=UPI0019030BE9|nr:uncharacterized protein EI90DRAFT_3133307 [Cantharellus anzutake]KAF8318309.1 hypothetical protein EI90DRAFT_3133307 [Cantharellus anzutake]